MTYPILVEFPALSPYAKSDCGVPYVHTFDSGREGAHVMVNALTHGNEVCGAIVVKALLDHGLRPRRGKLTLSFANVAAYETFDRTQPDRSRFLNRDFNRLWTAATLDDPAQDCSEWRRAQAMRPIIDQVDLLLDLHSMHERSAPLGVAGPLDKGVALARSLGVPANIVRDAGHAEGRRLRDYAGFGNSSSPRNALLVECGQHWDPEAVAVAMDCTARFLAETGVVDVADLPTGWRSQEPAPQQLIEVTDAVVADSQDFRFAGPYTGLESFPAAGTTIGWNAGKPVTTPYAHCVLVMPSLRQLRPGVTVVRFGRFV